MGRGREEQPRGKAEGQALGWPVGVDSAQAAEGGCRAACGPRAHRYRVQA